MTSSFPGAPRIDDEGCWMVGQVPTTISLEPSIRTNTNPVLFPNADISSG